jgi:predicted ATPase/DNA-binding SARP family transcriptional activator
MTSRDTFGLRILGPLQVWIDGRECAPAGALQRRLLSVLTLRRGTVVPADVLADVLWADRLPSDHVAALHTHVSRLRRLLGPDRLVRVGAGYRLALGPDDLDADRFVEAVTRAAALRGRDPAEALALLDDALGAWRGTPYEDLDELDDATVEADRLVEARRRAQEERFDCLLALDRDGDALADVGAFAAQNPLRERAHAQLMHALRRSGRLADALMAYDRYRRALAEDLGIEPSPALRQLHAEIVVGSTDDAAKPTAVARSVARRPGSGRRLPRQLSSFVGRDALLGDLVRMIADHRLVTLVGTGGAGKTRLAHEVTARLVDANEIWFCSLATAAPGTAAETVMATLDIEPRVGHDPVARTADVLRHQHGLVVLDNCEHVLDEAARLAEHLLDGAPGVSLLATSRERLAVDGEHLCPVPPLPLPRGHTLGEAAVRLFVDRGVAVRPHWDPDVSELAAVAEICRRLDGLPLAIELAAARLHTSTLDEIAAGLDRRLTLLTGGRRTSSRHRSLEAAIAWSYDLLDDMSRSMFDAVSVFQGSFTVAGAAAVSDRDEERAAEILGTLVERSLLQRDRTRYLMLESMRAYGLARLADRGVLEHVRRHHALHQIEFAGEMERRLRRADAIGVLDDVDESLADLRAAVRHLTDTGAADELLALVTPLRDFAVQRMRPEVLAWGEDAARSGEETIPGDLRVAEAYAMGGLGAWKRGDMARAEELLAAASPAGPAGPALLDLRATLALVQGRLDDAIGWSEQMVERARSVGDPSAELEGLGIDLLARAYAGDPAVEGRAADLLERLDDESPATARAWAWYCAGEALIDADPPLASERLAMAITLARACGSPFVLGVAGTSYASIAARTGDPAVAVSEYRWLLAHWRRAGVRSLLSTTLRSVAELLARIGSDRAAATLLGSALSEGTAHGLFGEDLRRLTALASSLSDRMGAQAYATAARAGRELDDGKLAAVAVAAFDAWEEEIRR